MKRRCIKPTAALLKRYARPLNLLELKDEREEQEKKRLEEIAAEQTDGHK